MSPRKSIPEQEVETLKFILNGLSSRDKELAADCKSLLEDYLKIDPTKANDRYAGVAGAPLLAHVIAKTDPGSEVLFNLCAKHLDTFTLNFLSNGTSLLSYLSEYKHWRAVLYTEKNFAMIEADTFNFGGNKEPASIVMLTLFPAMFLEDYIAKKFQVWQCKQYLGFQLFEKLLSDSVGISVLLKHRELRAALNDFLVSRHHGAPKLRTRLEEKPCQILQAMLAKEAKSVGYDNTSNLFQSTQASAGDAGYQNNNNSRYH